MSGKQRIGIFLPRLSRYGGVEQFTWRLAQALSREYQVDMICARKDSDPPEGVRAVVVGRHGLTKFGKMLWFMLAAERVRKRENYDLTIGMGKTLNQDLLRKSGGPEATFWKKHRRMYPPTVLPFKFLKRWLLEPQQPLKEYIERKQLKNARVVVAVSHLCRDWLVDRYPWLNEKIRIIYNKPDLTRFAPPTPERRAELRKEWDIPDNTKAVLFVGASSFRYKGLPTCIQALPLLPPEFTLLVAGGKPSAAYERQAKRLGVADRVRFLGKVEDMVGLYGAADVLTLPTLYDTCTNVVLEAMASGLAVVSSSDDGSSHFSPPDLVLADPQDPDELAAKVRLAVSRPARRLTWPDDLDAGMEPYLKLVPSMLQGD